MLGKILGLSINNELGTILGKDGNRYTFTTDEIDNESMPKKNMCVEFVAEDTKATNIHICQTCFKESSNLTFGITTIFITLIFGCIGTFVSRYLFAKQPLKEVLLPTILHFMITALLFIPILGLIIYTISIIYFTVKNYKIVMEQ